MRGDASGPFAAWVINCPEESLRVNGTAGVVAGAARALAGVKDNKSAVSNSQERTRLGPIAWR